jgi:hypothetical protein
MACDLQECVGNPQFYILYSVFSIRYSDCRRRTIPRSIPSPLHVFQERHGEIRDSSGGNGGAASIHVTAAALRLCITAPLR